jgi:uncharacterized protein YukE
MTQPAPSCFTQDNSRADGLTGSQIYTLMTTGPGTGTAQAGATAASGLERAYAGIESRLKRVGETLGETWTGASADAAQAAANPINQSMIQMQDALRQADHSLSNQVYQFNYNKGQLKDMPASKPDTGFWDDATPWDTDTEDAVNSYNSEESHNRKVYSEFQSASNTNRGELPKEFPGVTADTLNVEITDTGGDNGDDKTTNVSNSSSSHGTNTGPPNTTGSPQGPSGTTWTPPGSTTGDQTNTSWVNNGGGDDGKGGINRPGDLGGTGGKPLVGSVIDRPPNTGIPPIGVPGGPGLGGPGGSGRGGAGGGAGGAGGGKLGGGGGGAGGSGRLGGGGLGGVGSGTGTGSSGSAGQQPGGKSGVFGGMGESATGAGARGGAAGAGGRAGAAGMGGMGGHGQKGEGEDDLEHKSADYLITEENTNEIIGDMPMVAPPTIGG